MGDRTNTYLQGLVTANLMMAEEAGASRRHFYTRLSNHVMKLLVCLFWHRPSYFHVGHKIDGRWHYDSWCDICHREWRS